VAFGPGPRWNRSLSASIMVRPHDNTRLTDDCNPIRWDIPDTELVPAHLVGAQTRVRHTRTDKERKANQSRSKALRVFPESDERFALLAPRRNDSESNNADKKSRMWKGRCRTLRHQSVEFNAISYQIHMAVTALVAYRNRTGADMSRWFGQHQLPQKVRPQPTLAQAA